VPYGDRVQIAVAGSVATDHLMTFPGRFTDSLVAEKLDRVSLSFLVDDLDVRRGGVGANIAFGLAALGLRPFLVGAVGHDFGDYRSWLERHGVDCSHVHESETQHTARFVVTTDADHNQIASFYPGAMREAALIELAPLAERIGGLDLVLIGADDPEAMLRHTDECRERGYAFVADPSQQLPRMDRVALRSLIDGAAYLFTNEYEAALTEQRTGWSSDDILARVGTRVTTLGSNGALVERAGDRPMRVGCATATTLTDPTGVGDAFRAGYLTGLAWGLGDERCAQVGAMLAAYVIETVGTQEYVIREDEFAARFTASFGADAAAEVVPHLHRIPVHPIPVHP
jgi:adenosine kinase